MRRPEPADARSRLRELRGSRGVRVNLGQRKIAKDEEQIAAKCTLNRLEDGEGFSIVWAPSRRIRSASPCIGPSDRMIRVRDCGNGMRHRLRLLLNLAPPLWRPCMPRMPSAPGLIRRRHVAPSDGSAASTTNSARLTSPPAHENTHIGGRRRPLAESPTGAKNEVCGRRRRLYDDQAPSVEMPNELSAAAVKLGQGSDWRAPTGRGRLDFSLRRRRRERQSRLSIGQRQMLIGSNRKGEVRSKSHPSWADSLC